MPKVCLSVYRSPASSQAAPLFEDYEVEVSAQASVLDAVWALQRGPCPDLAFRFSCRVGMCGSCAMVVNGRERLTCSTLVKAVGDKLRLEPLRNLPVVRDLAVDWDPFFSAYRKTLPHFVPRSDLETNEFYALPHHGTEWQARPQQPQCIDCAACFSACSLVTLHPRYLGPMALHRALSLITDPRDGQRDHRLRLVTGEDGSLRCHTLGNCGQACPRGISPTDSISQLKRLAVRDSFRSWFDKLLAPSLPK